MFISVRRANYIKIKVLFRFRSGWNAGTRWEAAKLNVEIFDGQKGRRKMRGQWKCKKNMCLNKVVSKKKGCSVFRRKGEKCRQIWEAKDSDLKQCFSSFNLVLSGRAPSPPQPELAVQHGTCEPAKKKIWWSDHGYFKSGLKDEDNVQLFIFPWRAWKRSTERSAQLV